jgi:hypothetical protein
MTALASRGKLFILSTFVLVGCSTAPEPVLKPLSETYCAQYPTVRGCPGSEEALAAKYSGTGSERTEVSGQRDVKATGEQSSLRLLARNLDPEIKKLTTHNLEKNRLLLVVEKPSKGTYEVSVKQNELVERDRPERTQTIRYGQHQLNMLGALFFMPRNATYAYDLTTGGIDVKYSYDVRIDRAGRTVFDDRVSGTAKADYGFCTDARIQNVFGGIEPAPFIANSDMQQRCTQRQEADRGEAYKAIADVIARSISVSIAKDIAGSKS